jgi:tetratricopeptide (TPR) repeat protein
MKLGVVAAITALALPATLAAQQRFDDSEERGIAITSFDNITRTGQITLSQVIRALDAVDQPYILTDVDVRSDEDAVQLADDTNAIFTLDGYERDGDLYFVINWSTRGAQVVLGDPEAVASEVLQESFVLTSEMDASFAADYIKGSIAYVFDDEPVALEHLAAAYNSLPPGGEIASQALQLFSSYAVLLNRYEDFEAALNVNEFVFAIDPEFDFGYYTKARSLRFLDRFDEALETIEIALSLDTDNASYYSELGRIFILMDRFDEASSAYETALELNPSNAIAIVGMGDVAYFSGDVAGSIDYYTEALNLDPTYTYALYSRAYSYKDLNQPELAVDDLLAALEIDPDYLDVLQTLGDVYFILGDIQNAQLRYQEYLDKGGQPQDYILERLGS